MSTELTHSAAALQAAEQILSNGGRITITTPDGETRTTPSEPIVPRKHIFPPAEAFFDDETPFMAATNLEHRATELIARYREIAFLASVDITYLWKGKGGKKGGKARLGACQAASGLVAYFGETEFVIWLAADHCRGGDGSPGLTEEQIEALLFHEMSHIGWDDDADKAIVVGHDFSEFRQVIEHYGLWLDDARMMAHTMKQLELGVPA